MLNTHKKKVLSSLENEFILSEFSRRTYMTIPKQDLNSDHRFRCDIFLLHTLSNVHKTNAECEIKSRPSIILNFAERIKKKQEIHQNKQVANLIVELMKKTIVDPQKELIPISRHHVQKLLVFCAVYGLR